MGDAEISPDQRQPFACLICRQRKVKCDRRDPCFNCVRASQECRFVAPVRGKRKRTKPVQEGLHAKLRRYEEILKSHGATLDDDNGDNDDDVHATATSISISATSSVFDGGATDRSHSSLPTTALGSLHSPSTLRTPSSFHQLAGIISTPNPIKGRKTPSNSGYSAWSNVSNLNSNEAFPKYPKENEILPDDSSDEESDLLLGHGAGLATKTSLAKHHPTLDMMEKIIEVYTDRVDPMVKILHLPTLRISLLETVRQPENAEKALQALMFSVYLITVQSLANDECQKILKENKTDLFRRLKRFACQALQRARFMQTSDTTTLQAYVLYILAVRSTHTTDTFHILTGIAVRLACKMGLQTDGTSLGLSPFETEMRRRLWWTIMQLDMRTAGILGVKPSMDLFLGLVELPLNVPDEHLSPEMKDFPAEVRHITSACVLLLRCEVFCCISKFHPGKTQGGSTSSHDTAEISGSWLAHVSQRDGIIDELNSRLESKFIRYCDPTNSLDYLVLMMARSSVCVSRIKFGNEAIRRYADRGASVPEAERDAVFTASIKMLTLYRLTRQNAALDKYMWQSGISILWNAVLWVLIEVRRRKVGPDVDKAWDLVGAVLSDPLPTFQKTKSVVYKVLEHWIIEAWDTCVKAHKEQGNETCTPSWIAALQTSREPAPPSSMTKDDMDNSQSTDVRQTWYSDGRTPVSDTEAFDPYSFSDLLSFELAPAEWTQWESLVAHEEIGGF